MYIPVCNTCIYFYVKYEIDFFRLLHNSYLCQILVFLLDLP